MDNYAVPFHWLIDYAKFLICTSWESKVISQWKTKIIYPTFQYSMQELDPSDCISLWVSGTNLQPL